MTSNSPQARPDRIDLPLEFLEELWPGTVTMPPAGRGPVKVAAAPSRSHASPAAFDVLHNAIAFLTGLARRKRSKVFPA
jgi:hypothetical protein